MKAFSVGANKMAAYRHFCADTRKPDVMSKAKLYE